MQKDEGWGQTYFYGLSYDWETITVIETKNHDTL